MVLVWVIVFILKLYMLLFLFSVDFIVFNYGIVTYLVKFYIFFMVFGMGMIRVSFILILYNS